MAPLRVRARTEAAGPGSAWAFILLPKKATAYFGTKARVSVKGTVNGFAFRSSAFPSGDGTHILQFNRKMQEGANAAPGATVDLVLAIDAAPKENAPPELATALAKNAAAKKFWAGLTAGYQRLYVDWIAGAKKEETRVARAAKAAALLAKGEKTPR